MSSSSNTNMIEELAKDYANYAKINLPLEKQFYDTIEDVMIRLEEFQSIVEMVQAESNDCIYTNLPRIMLMKSMLEKLCRRIDALERVLLAANVSLTALENSVCTAEVVLGVVNLGIFDFITSLPLFKKPQEPVIRPRDQPFEPPEIFKADDYFNAE